MENNPQKTRNRRLTFVTRAIVIFFALIVLLSALNLAPLGIRELNNSFFSLFIHDERDRKVGIKEISDGPVNSQGRNGVYAEPIRINIPKIKIDTKVLNPVSEEVKALDEALLYGAVRYPGSGDLESKRNVFIFGHSSYLSVVNNQSFKTFNRLQELKKGDEVKVFSKNREYTYRVSEVKLTTADAAFVDLSAHDRKLILSTCNSFGKKQERYVVTADFVESKKL